MSTTGDILDAVGKGQRVALAGASGEPVALLDAWRQDPSRTRDLSILTCAVAGINRFDIAHWTKSCTATGLFLPRECQDAYRDGRYRWLPTSYGGFVRDLREHRHPIDMAVVQLSVPGPDGRHSLGLSAEFMPMLIEQASQVIGIINHAMPYVQHAPSLAPVQLARTWEVDVPLTCYDPGVVDSVSQRIAALIADRVPNGAALQVGIGKVPAALFEALTGHKGLRLQSGMLGDGFRVLAEAGALDPNWRHQGCTMVGAASLYEWAADRDDFSIAGCEETHSVLRLGQLARFVAVNSALEVDLQGQCNLEFVDGQPISGAGGAPDFARMARLSPEGLSIVALPSTASRGATSRIKVRLPAPGLASLSRVEIDLVVTEHGVADLRGLADRERAERLISVAAPSFRDELLAEWRHAVRHDTQSWPQSIF